MQNKTIFQWILSAILLLVSVSVFATVDQQCLQKAYDRMGNAWYIGKCKVATDGPWNDGKHTYGFVILFYDRTFGAGYACTKDLDCPYNCHPATVTSCSEQQGGILNGSIKITMTCPAFNSLTIVVPPVPSGAERTQWMIYDLHGLSSGMSPSQGDGFFQFTPVNRMSR